MVQMAVVLLATIVVAEALAPVFASLPAAFELVVSLVGVPLALVAHKLGFLESSGRWIGVPAAAIEIWDIWKFLTVIHGGLRRKIAPDNYLGLFLDTLLLACVVYSLTFFAIPLIQRTWSRRSLASAADDTPATR
jgi:hypothetical protein